MAATHKPTAATRKKPTRSAKPPAQPGGQQIIYVLSDSTGNLPRHMLTALLTQFPHDAFSVRSRNFLQTEAKLGEALDEITRTPGIVFHALVSDKAKRLVEQHCRKIKAPCCDLTGGFVEFLSKQSGIEPQQNPHRLHNLDEAYRQRIKALEFALEHDDGLGLDTLHEADIVLAGVSRTSKTPTSIYLAQQGFRVGNVSLALGLAPPKQLLSLPAGKVVGLVIDPNTLAEIRTRRQTEWGMSGTSYNNPDHVAQEILWSRRLFGQQGWPVLNVTDQAVEETAAKILHSLRLGPVGGA